MVWTSDHAFWSLYRFSWHLELGVGQTLNTLERLRVAHVGVLDIRSIEFPELGFWTILSISSI